MLSAREEFGRLLWSHPHINMIRDIKVPHTKHLIRCVNNYLVCWWIFWIITRRMMHCIRVCVREINISKGIMVFRNGWDNQSLHKWQKPFDEWPLVAFILNKRYSKFARILKLYMYVCRVQKIKIFKRNK